MVKLKKKLIQGHASHSKLPPIAMSAINFSMHTCQLAKKHNNVA
jgi:hypothetical protein